MKSKFIQIATFIAIALGTMGDACNPDFGTIAINYKAAIDQTLGTNYTEWANYAMTGRLGHCVLAKPPAGSVFASRCSYYIRTKVTNSQGLKGWPGGTGCIPNPNYKVYDRNLWAHTFTTLGYPINPVGWGSTPPTDVKAYAGQKIAELFHADTDDSRCDFTSYIANNNTRLMTFNAIDYLSPTQLSHIIFAQQTPGGAVSCGYYLPDSLPWLETNGTRSCRQPIFQLSANFCKIAYNRYIITHGGFIPTLGNGMIAYSTFTTMVGYQSLSLINNPESVSSLTSRFTGYDAIPFLTDFVPLRTGPTQNTWIPYVSGDGFLPFPLGIGGGTWNANLIDDVTMMWLFPITFMNYTSNTQRTPNGTFRGIPQSYLSPGVVAMASAYYSHYNSTYSYGDPLGDAHYFQDHPGGEYSPTFTVSPFYYTNSDSYGQVVPPNNYARNPYTDNTQSLNSYQLISPPGLGGIPFNLLDGATVTFDQSANAYKIQNTSIPAYVNPQTMTQFYTMCNPGTSWQSQLVPVINNSGLSALIPMPPGGGSL